MAPSAAYTAAAADFSKQVQWLVEIDLDRCAEQYTQAPCTAADAGDGARCFYSFQTCQDAANYNKGTRTYRFHLNDVPWPDTATVAYPLLAKITQAPHRVSTSSFFSYPDKITFKMLRDYAPPVPDHDKGGTAPNEFYNTTAVGEFWRNLFSRNRNYSGRAVRLLRGFNASGFVLSDFEQVGPPYRLSKVKFTPGGCDITVESPLAKLKDTEIPFSISEDNLSTKALNNSELVITATDGAEFPDPADYTRNNIYVEIEDDTNGDEICLVSSISTNNLTVVRGSFGTTAVAHAANVRLRHVCCFGTTAAAAVNSVDTLQDLMEWATVVSGDVDTTAFNALRDIYWPNDDVLRIVRTTRTVARLMQEIRDSRGILVYLDADAKWSASMIGPAAPVASYDDDSMRKVVVMEDDTERRTRVAIWYDPVEDSAKEPADFRKAIIVVDSDLETANNYGDVRERKIMDLWLAPSYAAAKIRNLARRIITRTAHGDRSITFELEVKDGVRYVGDAVELQTRELTDIYGTQLTVPGIIVSRREAGRGAMQFTAADSNFSGRFFVWGPDTMTDAYDTATEDDKRYGYWGDTNNRVGSSFLEGYRLL